MFFLALHNPLLNGVDPFNPSISAEEILMVTQEVFINPWYFFREIARAPSESGAAARKLEANRGNIGLFWSFFNHVMTALIQIRQTGKSFNADVLAALLIGIRCRNTQINLLTKDETLRRANIQRLKDILAAFPYYLNPITRKDANNTEIITVNEYGNLYQGHLPSASEKLAGNKGRGLTSPVFFVDESPFQSNIQEALPAALGAGVAARNIARDAGEPYGTILTTTAGKKDTKEGGFMFKMISGMAEWSDRFYDAKDQADLERLIRNNGRDREYRVNITLNHQQVGKTDEWLREAMAASVATADKADRDFFNRWTSGTASSPLSVQALETIRNSQRSPLFEDICNPGGYVVRWFIPEAAIEARMAKSKFIVVLDTSEASGGDDISLRMTDIYTGECIATGTYNETNIITFAEWVATWVIRWESTTLLIERRSTGSAVLDMLWLILPSKGIDPFTRIFNRIVNEHDEMPDRYKEISEPMWRRAGDIYAKNKKSFGFATSSSGVTSRSDLYGSTLHSAAKQVGHLVYDKTTIDQIAGLIVKNGRVDHPAGEHDDMCFVGSTLVRTIDGNRPIKDLKLGDLVLTREGYKPIIKLFCSEKNVITKYGITGTPNHPFITPAGEMEFQSLQPETKVYVWNEKLSSIEEKRIIDTQILKEYNTRSISIDTTNGMNHQLLFTDKFTKTHMVQSHQNIMSTIRTMIIPTTRQITLKRSYLARILKNTRRPKRTDKNAVIGVKSLTISTPGKKKIQSLSKSMLLKTGKTTKAIFQTGEKRTQNLPNKSILQLVKKEAKQPRKEIVYNLMVADCHEYFVNDILVHNCIGWILSHWFMTKARNLQHYGINPANILKDIRATVAANPLELMKLSIQQKLRAQIDEIVLKFQKETDEFMARRYENDLRYMYTRLELQENEKMTVDELITKAKEEKLRKRIGKSGSGSESVQARQDQFSARRGSGATFSSTVYGNWRH